MSSLKVRAPLLWQMQADILTTLMTETRKLVMEDRLSRDIPEEMYRHILSFMQPGCFYHKQGLQAYFDASETIEDIDFTGADFSGLQITEKYFFGCTLENMTMRGTNFRETRIKKCYIINVSFMECQLSRAVIQSNRFETVLFKECMIHNADICYNSFEKCDFDKCNMLESSMVGSSFILAGSGPNM